MTKEIDFNFLHNISSNDIYFSSPSINGFNGLFFIMRLNRYFQRSEKY